MKVKLAGETVTSPVSEEDKSMTTEELGAVFKTTVNVSVVPDSATLVPPPLSVIVIPAASLSVVTTLTV